MNNFYEQELKALKEAKYGEESTLSDAELDLNTEQVLNGLASLTARIRQDMTDSENEIARDFINSIAPELLIPLPARSLAEILPSPSDNQEREIPHGSLLLSKGKNNNEMAFFWRVIGEHKFKPSQKIISVKATEDSQGFDCLEFESSGDGPWIIFIDGESELAWGLWLSMLEHAKPFVIAKPENPWELCRDFFCFEEKFRYIYMENLPQKLRFAKKMPKNIFAKIQTENFKLNTLPIENAFEQDLDPVFLDSGSFETEISPLEKRQSILYLKEVLAGDIKKASFKNVEYRYNSGKIRLAMPPNANALSICAMVCDGISATNALESNAPLQVKNPVMQMCGVRSVIKALPFLPSPQGDSPEWGIFGLLQKNYMQFFEGNSLKSSLEMQAWNVQGKRNYLAHGIKGVFLESKSAVHKGCIVPKASIKIVLSLDFFSKNNYEFLGTLNAYGNMLFCLFKKIFICNMFVEMVLLIEPFGMELKWE
ncbi:MAG: type VI secretion system baseplate subunit TssF [Fibromonadaceae bacterium]|jgi:type VI protein secretion system component VasA|nr:type VI secretion system baseplate subunit TssF [Fibromonadaceae bacterium]